MSAPARLAMFEARESALNLAVTAWIAGAYLEAEAHLDRAYRYTRRLKEATAL